MSPRPSSLPFSLLLIADEESAAKSGRSVVDVVTRALAAKGAHRVAVLLRDKVSAGAHVEQRARALLPVVEGAGARLLLHSHVEIAVALGLSGLHLASGREVRGARERLPRGALLGASRHRGDALDEGALAALDYVLLSPVFRPTSKPDDERPPLGLAELREATARSARPVVALGGVTPVNAAPCLSAGAAAIAVLGGVVEADDPSRALAAYLEVLDEVPC